MNLEEVWRIREEQVYPSLLGGASRGIFTLSQALFGDRFGQTDVDPRWLFVGVFEFAPTSKRPFWIYVTSGHSNPWDEAPEALIPKGPSGAGVEFLLATTEQGEWAIREVLGLLAFDILLRAGRYPGKQPLADGDRIPLRAPINGDPACMLRNILISFAGETWPGFSLPSGEVRFLTLVGVSDAEVSYAKTAGSDALAAALSGKGYYPVTDTHRQSLLYAAPEREHQGPWDFIPHLQRHRLSAKHPLKLVSRRRSWRRHRGIRSCLFVAIEMRS